KEFYSNWIIIINASIASSLAIFLVYKLKFHGLHGKTHAALAVGLVLWLSADIVWAIYQLVLDIVPPMPSAADYLWLCGYGFLGYYLFMTYKEFQKKFNFGRKALVISIIGNAIFLSYMIALTANLSVLTSSKGIQMFEFVVAYPILDSILMVPAIVILVEFRKEPVWFTPWIFESLGIFLIAISDSWFAVIVLTSLVEQVWLSAVFFAAHLLVMAAGLLWYIKLLIPSITTHEISRKEAPTTKIAPTSSTRRPTGKRKVQTIAIAGGALFASVLIGILVYPSSPLNAVFTNTKAEVIAPPNDGKKIVTLGALLPLTGAWATVGKSENAAIKIAVKDVNQYLSKSNSNIRIGLIVEDTGTDPAIGLEKLQDLASKDVRIVIGPATSAELNVLQYYASQKGIMLISPSSTAPSLAVVGNNVYRFIPDDTYQAQAISRLMWQEGVRVVVPMWRTDIYGNELVGTVKEDFEKLGGTVLPGIGYIPYTGDFSSSLNRINFIIWSQDLKSLDSKVSQAVTQYGANKVGVYLVAFDEVAPIFIEAQNLPVLSDVKWFGSDGSVLNNKLVKNMDAALFAVKTGFVNPIYAIDNKSYKLKLIDNQIQQMIGRVPRAYAEVTYDAFWVAALTENATLGTNDINYLKKTFVQIANSYTGITGDTSLNEAGDRKHGDYDFWAIKPSTNNNFAWTQIGRFQINVKDPA
ncbi:MAG TPA: penicillin-binding protein activator, partial [Candidatus Bathyarchaeia archaeon]|nr:penicillin-binding protein activator [Candidatus Bathyarchaeia archaeon]